MHPAVAQASRSLGHVPRRALILGGGDGLAARELLRYEGLQDITMVDLDPVMTDLASKFPLLKEQNGGSLSSSKLHLHNADAMQWLEEHARRHDPARYDVAIVDFPDPSSFAVGKLYHALLSAAARPSRRGRPWCNRPRRSSRDDRSGASCARWKRAAFRPIPITPSCPLSASGDMSWRCPDLSVDLQVCLSRPLDPLATVLPPGLRYVDASMLHALFVLSPDMTRPQSEAGDENELLPNRLNNQILVSYYEREWKRWN